MTTQPPVAYTLEALGQLITGRVVSDQPNRLITGVSSIKSAKPNTLVPYFSDKYITYLETLPKTVALLCREPVQSIGLCQLISSSQPVKAAMSHLSRQFTYSLTNLTNLTNLPTLIHASVNKPSSLAYGKGVIIDDHTTIGHHVSIGDYCAIGKHCVIESGVVLEANTRIGDYCHIGANSVIGSEGFNYITTDTGTHDFIHHQAGVWIGDYVSIGSLITVHRGVLQDTCIGSGTKIDSHVHVGHNVVIGDNCLIAGGCRFSGSSKLGSNSIVAGDVGIKDHTTIGSNSIILAKSGVTKSWPDNSVISGFPAQKHHDDLRYQAQLKRLVQQSSNHNKL